MKSKSALFLLSHRLFHDDIGKKIFTCTNDYRALKTDILPFHSDDLTVQVIFFGNGPKTGEVKINEEATAQEDIKAKL